METFKGYKRPDGGCGIRNKVAIVSNVVCANSVAQQIAARVPGAVPLLHTQGCTRPLEKPIHIKCLVGLATNPNIYGAVVISLGCEGTPASAIVEGIRKSGRPVELIVIQDAGTVASVEKGVEIASRMAADAAKLEREDCPVSKLMIGLECGGSDAMSGVTANPAIGMLSDWLVERGGTTVLTEMTELIGTTQILVRRAKNEAVAERLLQAVQKAQDIAVQVLGPNAGRAIAPGNMDGGMSTIQEKSLGCMRKGGSSPIMEVVDYGSKPSEQGLIIMDGPGNDAESITGLSAMGCQIIFFTTGRGNPLGHVVTPVVKVASNDELFARMPDNMDINCGVMLEEGYRFEDMQKEMVALMLRVANGEQQTKAEIHDPEPILSLMTWTPAV